MEATWFRPPLWALWSPSAEQSFLSPPSESGGFLFRWIFIENQGLHSSSSQEHLRFNFRVFSTVWSELRWGLCFIDFTSCTRRNASAVLVVIIPAGSVLSHPVDELIPVPATHEIDSARVLQYVERREFWLPARACGFETPLLARKYWLIIIVRCFSRSASRSDR